MKKSKLPKSLTSVTMFSKLLALLLFFAFLGSAFCAGILFDQKFNSGIRTIFLTPNPIQHAQSQTSCTTDSDCTLVSSGNEAVCCPNTVCLDFSKDSTIAISLSWQEKQKQATCAGRYMCPMIMTICARNVVVNNAHYIAKCIQHMCQKVKI